MRQAWRLPDVQWTVGRDPRPPGSSFADGRRLYRINARPVRVALTVRGLGMRMAEVAASEVQALRTKWAAAPVHVRGMAGAYVEPIVSALDAMAAAVRAQDAVILELQRKVSSYGA